jgi:hypothetical protein
MRPMWNAARADEASPTIKTMIGAVNVLAAAF